MVVGVDLVGFVLIWWFNARICGLIVAILCFLYSKHLKIFSLQMFYSKKFYSYLLSLSFLSATRF